MRDTRRVHGRRDRHLDWRLGHPAGPQPPTSAWRPRTTATLRAARPRRKYTRSFDDVFRADGDEMLVTLVQGPNAKRWSRLEGTLKALQDLECRTLLQLKHSR